MFSDLLYCLFISFRLTEMIPNSWACLHPKIKRLLGGGGSYNVKSYYCFVLKHYFEISHRNVCYPWTTISLQYCVSLKGSSHIWFSVGMHVSASVSTLIFIVWLANICIFRDWVYTLAARAYCPIAAWCLFWFIFLWEILLCLIFFLASDFIKL